MFKVDTNGWFIRDLLHYYSVRDTEKQQNKCYWTLKSLPQYAVLVFKIDA